MLLTPSANINVNVPKYSTTRRQCSSFIFYWHLHRALANKFAHTLIFGSFKFGIQIIRTQFNINMLQPLAFCMFQRTSQTLMAIVMLVKRDLCYESGVLGSSWLSLQSEMEAWKNYLLNLNFSFPNSKMGE